MNHVSIHRPMFNTFVGANLPTTEIIGRDSEQMTALNPSHRLMSYAILPQDRDSSSNAYILFIDTREEMALRLYLILIAFSSDQVRVDEDDDPSSMVMGYILHGY